jgi:hypothetical protein
MWAAYFGHLELVKMLVQAGADKEKQHQVSAVRGCDGIVLFWSVCVLTAGLISIVVSRIGARRSCGQLRMVIWR